jgi:prolipoprotein diacylglyceryltransferase
LGRSPVCCWWLAGTQKDAIRYLDAGLGILLAALVGGRIFAVVMNWGYYQSHPGEILQVWLGGLSGIGALVGGSLAIMFIAGWWKVPFGALADSFFPLAGTLTVTAWLGCWVDSCGYGVPSSAWWALPGRDIWGVLANRVPVQLMGASLTLILIWLLERAGKQLPHPGMSATIGLFGISAEIFALSFLRLDPTPTWQGLCVDAWGALGLMIFSAVTEVVLLVRWKYKRAGSTGERFSVPEGKL